MLRRILLGLALLSLAGNGVLYGQLQRAKRDIVQVKAEATAAANERLATALELQAEADAARVTELLRRLEVSDQVASAAIDRERATRDLVTQYQREQEARASQDASYAAWAHTPLPEGVADKLRALQ